MQDLHRICQKLILFAFILAAAVVQPATAQAICQDKCGDLRIPFPFGTKDGCHLNEDFLITCNASNIPLLGNYQVINVSVQGQLRVLAPAAYDCYDKYGNYTNNSGTWFPSSKFSVSHTLNKFTAVGCDTFALVQGTEGYQYATGCISYCVRSEDLVNGSCSGTGCCQSSIPEKVKDFNVSIGSFYRHEFVWNYNPCSYAFMVEENSYEFSSLDLTDLRKVREFPVVLDWAIGNETCKDAQRRPSYACRENSICYEPDNGYGYRCNCTEGYGGNPYISHGCRDIDECKIPSLNQCTHHCKNTIGNYTCHCPKGYYGDGRKDGSGCTPVHMSRIDRAIIGVSTSIFVLFVLIAIAYFVVRRRNTNKLKEKHFKENGGLMLQQLISKAVGPEDERAKIFTLDQLKKATNDFNQTEIIGRGGFGTVYKATLDGKEVAIKKSKGLDSDQVDQFINEVTVLSQINHPNVVKLIGCCLETPVPLLVYEFITNNTLDYHLHSEHREHSLSWETRLRIAEDSASALAHMHSDTPIQIIHRDVKAANILLDDDFTAKVSDFGVSRLVPVDQTHLSTIVQGTLGYMDPEYFHSGMLNEKSDVYSFGVVLLELLTGEMVLSPNRTEKDKSLAMIFISAMKDDRLFEILDERVKSEGDPEQIKGVAELARRCLGLKGEKRPTMKEVKRILRELRTHKCYNGEVAADAEETDPLLGLPANFNGGSSYSDPQSLHNQEFTQLTSGR